MRIKLDKKRAMNWRFVLEDDLKISHSGINRCAGKHEITPGGLQAGGGNAGGLVGGLAKRVGNSAKIGETKFPEQLRNSRDVRGVSVEIACNKYGALRVRAHLSYDGSDDGVGFGSLDRKLGSVCEPINDVA